MQLLEVDIERAAQALLGGPLKVAIATQGLDPGCMTPGERARLDLVATARRESWLKGRAALKRLLAALGEDEDTSAISFPNRRLSLTHAAGYAVAVAAVAPRLTGVGVDLETERAPHPESARFFLTHREREWLAQAEACARPMHLLRLWTVKEALFKSDPDNQRRGLLDYALEDPEKVTGDGCALEDGSLRIRYATLQLERGFLSIAVSSRKEA